MKNISSGDRLYFITTTGGAIILATLGILFWHFVVGVSLTQPFLWIGVIAPLVLAEIFGFLFIPEIIIYRFFLVFKIADSKEMAKELTDGLFSTYPSAK